MKFKKYMYIAAALLVIGAVSAVPTMAYFTDTHQTSGRVLVNIADSELTPKDSAEGLLKTVSVTNTSEYDVYLRVKAIYSKNFNAKITDEAKANGWSENTDGYFYYGNIVAAGESTPELKLQIEVIDNNIAESFNVVIVEEATKVLYNEDGSTYCDWTSKVMNREEYDAKFSDSDDSVETDNAAIDGDINANEEGDTDEN